MAFDSYFYFMCYRETASKKFTTSCTPFFVNRLCTLNVRIHET